MAPVCGAARDPPTGAGPLGGPRRVAHPAPRHAVHTIRVMVTKIRLRKELSWRKVGTTIVILDLDASIYLSATGAAVVIWECLA